MSEQQTKTTPGWASQIAVGMYVAAIGFVCVGLGAAFGAAWLTGIATLLTAIGAAIALIGGAAYFMRIRR